MHLLEFDPSTHPSSQTAYCVHGHRALESVPATTGRKSRVHQSPVSHRADTDGQTYSHTHSHTHLWALSFQIVNLHVFGHGKMERPPSGLSWSRVLIPGPLLFELYLDSILLLPSLDLLYMSQNIGICGCMGGFLSCVCKDGTCLITAFLKNNSVSLQLLRELWYCPPSEEHSQTNTCADICAPPTQSDPLSHKHTHTQHLQALKYKPS